MTPGSSTSSSCRPTRPGRCTSATPAARSSATCCAASSRPAASGSRASTTSTTRAARSATSARPSRRSGAASRSPRTATRATTSADLAAALPDDVWAAATRRRAPTPRTSSGAGRPAASARASRRSLEAPRRPLRRLDERGPAPRRGLGRAGRRAPARARPRLRAGRRALVPLDRLRRRQGPGHHPLERRADLLRRRHRLRHREVQPRLRPPHLHLGRRPPRHGRPGPQRRRGDGLRPRGRPGAALLAGSASSATAQEVSMSKRAGEFITLDELLAEVGVGRRALVLRVTRRVTSAIDFDIELAKKQSNENPVYYVQYAHARIASILRKAAEAGLAPATDVAGCARRARPRRPWPGPSSRFPEVVEDAVAAEETQGITAYATELATAFHAFYRDARVVDADGARSGRRRGWPWRGATQDHAGQRARRCWGSPRPSRCRRPARRRRRARPAARRQPASSRTFATRLDRGGVTRRPATQRVVPPVAGHDLARRRRPSRARSWRRPRTRRRRPSVSQRSCQATAQAPSGPSRTASRSPPQPAAASRGRRLRHAALAQPDPELELAERVLERRPSSRSRAAPRGRPARRPSTGASRRRTSPGGGSARSSGQAGRTARRRAAQPPCAMSALDERERRSCTGTASVSRRIAGIRPRTACCRVGGPADDRPQLRPASGAAIAHWVISSVASPSYDGLAAPAIRSLWSRTSSWSLNTGRSSGPGARGRTRGRR